MTSILSRSPSLFFLLCSLSSSLPRFAPCASDSSSSSSSPSFASRDVRKREARVARTSRASDDRTEDGSRRGVPGDVFFADGLFNETSRDRRRPRSRPVATDSRVPALRPRLPGIDRDFGRERRFSARNRVGVSGAVESLAPCGGPFELSRAAGRPAHARPRPTPKSLDRAGARATPQQLIAVRSVDATAVARMIVKFRAAAAATAVAAARPSGSVNLAERMEGKGR